MKKEPYSELYTEKFQTKYNDIKSKWRRNSDMLKNGSGLAHGKVPN